MGSSTTKNWMQEENFHNNKLLLGVGKLSISRWHTIDLKQGSESSLFDVPETSIGLNMPFQILTAKLSILLLELCYASIQKWEKALSHNKHNKSSLWQNIWPAPCKYFLNFPIWPAFIDSGRKSFFWQPTMLKTDKNSLIFGTSRHRPADVSVPRGRILTSCLEICPMSFQAH